MTLDQEVVDLLRRSKEQLGDINPVILDTDGEVLSGRHRVAAKWMNKHIVDTEKLAERKGVPRAVAKEIVRSALNVQRKPSEEETKQSLTKAAKALADSGIQPGEIVDELAEHFPYSADYIRRLLPFEFKDPEKAKAGTRVAQRNW